jgi:hypothetical protein
VPDDLKEAVTRLGQAPPSGRQLFLLRMMGLIAPPKSAGLLKRIRGVLLLIFFVVALLGTAFGLVELIALPFGGVKLGTAIFLGIVLLGVVIGVLAFVGRRRQKRQLAARG